MARWSIEDAVAMERRHILVVKIKRKSPRQLESFQGLAPYRRGSKRLIRTTSGRKDGHPAGASRK